MLELDSEKDYKTDFVYDMIFDEVLSEDSNVVHCKQCGTLIFVDYEDLARCSLCASIAGLDVNASEI